MSAKAIREVTGKELLNKHLGAIAAKSYYVSVDEDTKWDSLTHEHQWLQNEKLVVKPDQLIKRRGKLGLIKVNVDLTGVKKWVTERMGKNVQVGTANGKLKNFIVEKFIPHTQEDEFYVCIYSHRYADTILFHHEGGVDIGDVDAKAVKLIVPIDASTTSNQIKQVMLKSVVPEKQEY